jgi:FSR family fosmidomycin resistance protein-like MFS transporter
MSGAAVVRIRGGDIAGQPEKAQRPPAERLGVVESIMVTEAATALLIAAPRLTPMPPMPLLGIVLSGTSSVLYGTVPVYGAVADHSSQSIGVLASAATAALIVPLVLMLRPYLRSCDEA